MDLLQRIEQALAAGEQTPTTELLSLYRECFAEHCNRRDRMARRLRSYLERNAPSLTLETTIMGQSKHFRFKSAFKDKKVIVHTPTTRYVTAANLTDEDVLALRSAQRGHFVEAVPGKEKEAEAALQALGKEEEAETSTAKKKKKTEPEAEEKAAEVAASTEKATSEKA